MADASSSDQKYYDFLGVSPSASISQLKTGWERKLKGDDYSVFGFVRGAPSAEIKKATQRATMMAHPDRLPARLKADPDFVTYSGHQFDALKKRADWLLDLTNASEWDVLPSNEQEAIKGIARCEWTMGAENDFPSGDLPFVATVSLDPKKTRYLQSALNVLRVHHTFDRTRSVIKADGWDALILRGYLRREGKDCEVLDDSRERGVFSENIRSSERVTTLFDGWMLLFVRHCFPEHKCFLTVFLQSRELAFFCQDDAYASKGMVALGLDPKISALSKYRTTYVTGKEASLLFDELAARGLYVRLDAGLESQVARAYEIVAKKSLPTPPKTQRGASSGGPSFG